MDSKDQALPPCPYCWRMPIVETKPACITDPWKRLGPSKKLSCPNGHIGTRFHFFNKAEKYWRFNVRTHERNMEKAELTRFARKC